MRPVHHTKLFYAGVNKALHIFGLKHFGSKYVFLIYLMLLSNRAQLPRNITKKQILNLKNQLNQHKRSTSVKNATCSLHQAQQGTPTGGRNTSMNIFALTVTSPLSQAKSQTNTSRPTQRSNSTNASLVGKSSSVRQICSYIPSSTWVKRTICAACVIGPTLPTVDCSLTSNRCTVLMTRGSTPATCVI